MLEEIDNQDLLELRRDVIIPNAAPMITRSDNQQRYFQNCRFIVAGLVEYCRSEFDEDRPLAFKMHRWLHVAPEEMEETKVALIDRLTYNHVDSTLLAAQTIMGRVDYTPEMMKELPETDWKETGVWGNYGGVCSYYKCSGKAVKKKGPLWFDHPEDINKVAIAEYRSVCATCFGKIHKKDLLRRRAALNAAVTSMFNLKSGVS